MIQFVWYFCNGFKPPTRWCRTKTTCSWFFELFAILASLKRSQRVKPLKIDGCFRWNFPLGPLKFSRVNLLLASGKVILVSVFFGGDQLLYSPISRDGIFSGFKTKGSSYVHEQSTSMGTVWVQFIVPLPAMLELFSLRILASYGAPSVIHFMWTKAEFSFKDMYLENKLLLIPINFTPKTSHNCLNKCYFPMFSR